jgi:hypothetical protein
MPKFIRQNELILAVSPKCRPPDFVAYLKYSWRNMPMELNMSMDLAARTLPRESPSNLITIFRIPSKKI